MPFGLFFGRLANFVNGELWGRPTDVPWAIVFPTGGEVPRHPSQLYEAGLEGILLFLVLWFLFWKTDARYQPGKLVGAFLLGYGLSRFLVELVRQPDQGLENLALGPHHGPDADRADDPRRRLADRHREGAAAAGRADRRDGERRLTCPRQRSPKPSPLGERSAPQAAEGRAMSLADRLAA